MKYIAVFCSARDVDAKYVNAAKEFGRLMAKNNYHLVWGGTDQGLMKTIASSVQENGGKLFGVSIDLFHEFARQNADEMIIAKTLGDRKAAMLEKGDAIVILVGGMGTLDEATEVIELKKQKKHNKPIVILNTDNFYEGLQIQLSKMQEDGFFSKPIEEFVYFADTPKQAIDYINSVLQTDLLTSSKKTVK